MGIANSVLEAVRTEMGLHPGTYPCKVEVRIGEMAAIDPDALRFCFEAIIIGTDLESLELGIEVCPRRHRCQVCGREFVVRDYDSRCPQCASLETTCISGDELELAYLEIEEYGPSAVGAKSTQRERPRRG
jgi:hydrogenase nickel incorporation protein HypA/HybF